MEKLYVDKWFKKPPKEEINKIYTISLKSRGSGRKKSKNGKSRQKTKK